MTDTWLGWKAGRVACRVFRLRNLTCRGRRDHYLGRGGKIDCPRWWR